MSFGAGRPGINAVEMMMSAAAASLEMEPASAAPEATAEATPTGRAADVDSQARGFAPQTLPSAGGAIRKNVTCGGGGAL